MDKYTTKDRMTKYVVVGALLGAMGGVMYFGQEPETQKVVELNAAAASDSEGICTSRLVWNGDFGDWKNWRGPSEAGRYACGMCVSTPDWSWYEDDKGSVGMKLKFCSNVDWNVQETVEVYGDGY